MIHDQIGLRTLGAMTITRTSSFRAEGKRSVCAHSKHDGKIDFKNATIVSVLGYDLKGVSSGAINASMRW